MQAILELLKVTITRCAYPSWYKFNIDDQSDNEEDWAKYRDELVTNVFGNIALLKPYRETLLKVLAELL